MDPLLKQLKIKSGSVKRLQKEFISYQNEEKKSREKLEIMKTQGLDEYEIKKYTEFLEETQSVLPGCKQRLQDSLNEIVQWMNENGDSFVVKDSEEKAQAQDIIQQANEFLEQQNNMAN
ncbi:tubulin-specific chaperone a, putative [Ichthyophthirius multifiliis]|uniref:Tubulin-specific chaperone A n=1 Tax=Ichthyophthirius multifiliis TaxID=5932 RepID=G0QQ33_ICHMU|nr:tubulin-specific chaperone a, putative [Ichthyophthirius multifiliis]EGR32675.1 tubulin-specific chaperone a, putative [Ichthyophthirius multifiliis]|eukprot:XP_004036661.1 tubulin-specific chaperone a, putative [Ichthyophthirius multifiliis]